MRVPKIYEILAEKYVIRSKWKKNKGRGPIPKASRPREVVQMDTIDFGEIFAFTAIDIYTREADILLAPELASLIPDARFVPLEGNIHFVFLEDTESILNNIFEFLGDPVPQKSTDDSGKEASLNNRVEHKSERKISKADPLSHLDEPISGRDKVHWLRLSNPIVYFTVILLASVAAGIILMLIKC